MKRFGLNDWTDVVLDLRYAEDDDDKEAMRSRIETVQEALEAGVAR